ARLQIEDVRRHLAGWNTLGLRRRRRNADVELNNAFLIRVVRHGVGANNRLRHFGFQFEEAKTLPVTTELRLYIEIRIFYVVRWTLQLNIPACAEVDVFAFWKAQRQF